MAFSSVCVLSLADQTGVIIGRSRCNASGKLFLPWHNSQKSNRQNICFMDNGRLKLSSECSQLGHLSYIKHKGIAYSGGTQRNITPAESGTGRNGKGGFLCLRRKQFLAALPGYLPASSPPRAGNSLCPKYSSPQLLGIVLLAMAGKIGGLRRHGLICQRETGGLLQIHFITGCQLQQEGQCR